MVVEFGVDTCDGGLWDVRYWKNQGVRSKERWIVGLELN